MELWVFYTYFINKVSVPASFFNDCFILRYFYIQGCILAQLKLSEVYLPTNEILWSKLRILIFILRALEGIEEFEVALTSSHLWFLKDEAFCNFENKFAAAVVVVGSLLGIVAEGIEVVRDVSSEIC